MPAELFLAAAFFFCPLNRWLLIEGQFGVSWSDAFLAAAVLAYLPIAVGQKISLRIPAFLLISAVLLSVSCLCSFVLGAGGGSVVKFLKLLISFLLVPLAGMWIVSGRVDATQRLLWLWLAGASLSAFAAVLDKNGFSLFGWENPASRFGGRAAGITYHPNYVGFSSALLIPVAFYLMTAQRSVFLRLVCVGLIGLLTAALLASGSRGSVLALAAAVVVWMPNPLGQRFTARQVQAMTIGVIAILALSSVLLLFGEQMFGDTTSALSRIFRPLSDTEVSNSIRTEALEIGLNGFWSSPLFGVGYSDIRGVHIAVVQMLYCGGLLAFAAGALWWLGMLDQWQKLRRAMPSLTPEFAWLPRMFFSVALVVIVNNMTQPLLTDRNGFMCFGLMLGLLNVRLLPKAIRPADDAAPNPNLRRTPHPVIKLTSRNQL